MIDQEIMDDLEAGAEVKELELDIVDGPRKISTRQRINADKEMSDRPESELADYYNKISRKLPQALKEINPDASPELEPFMLEMLNGLDYVTANDGTLEIHENGNVTHFISKSGVSVVLAEGEPLDSDANLDRILDSIVIGKSVGAKALNPNLSEEQLLIAAKAAELVGQNLKNMPEKTLDEVNPDLAKKMEDIWAAKAGAGQEAGIELYQKSTLNEGATPPARSL